MNDSELMIPNPVKCGPAALAEGEDLTGCKNLVS